MLVDWFALHYYVAHISLNIYPELMFEYLVHYPLIGCLSIFYPERHDSKMCLGR